MHYSYKHVFRARPQQAFDKPIACVQDDVRAAADLALSVLSRSADEFCLLADWNRSPRSLVFHAESLISWAPVEITNRPCRVEDTEGKVWHVCKFRYFGSVAERDQLVASVKDVLQRLTHWRDVDEFTSGFTICPVRNEP